MESALRILDINHLRAVDAINNLKQRVIKDYIFLLQKASVGKYLNYEPILEKISFIELGSRLPRAEEIYYHLMSN